jgi:citrate synthase
MAPDHAAGRAWSTALTAVEPRRLLVRGYPADELMGRVPFGDAVYLLLTGELPSPSIARLVNAMLTGCIDQGAGVPPAVAARQAAGAGTPLPGSVAAGLVGLGRDHGANMLECRALLEEGLERAGSSMLMTSAATDMVEQFVQADRIPPPGFGHAAGIASDPRVPQLLQMASELEVNALYTQFLRSFDHALLRHPALSDEPPLPINVDGAVAAICGDLGLSAQVAEALLIISRVPGLVAHAIEEQERQPRQRTIDPSVLRYDGPTERRVRDRR